MSAVSFRLLMATVTGGREPANRIEEYRFVVDSAGSRFAAFAVGPILGLPLLTYLADAVAALFYVHITLAAVWLGTDFFFRYVLAPAVDASGPETALSLVPHLSPRLMVVGESLTVGTIGSGIGLAHRLGYLAAPSVWVWGALGVAVVMLFVAFVPLHHYQVEMLVELDAPEPDGERVGRLNDRAMRWLAGMTGLFLLMLLMMVGLRGLIT